MTHQILEHHTSSPYPHPAPPQTATDATQPQIHRTYTGYHPQRLPHLSPASAHWIATAAEVDVLPTPPFPPKKTKRSFTPFLGCNSSSSPPETPFSSPAGTATLLSDRTPPAAALPLLLFLPSVDRAGAAAKRVEPGERCCCCCREEVVARRWAAAGSRARRPVAAVTRDERDGASTKAVVLLAVIYARERRAAGKDCDIILSGCDGMCLSVLCHGRRCFSVFLSFPSRGPASQRPRPFSIFKKLGRR